ncbi:hypothetical protein QR680_005421 [Steinernema hermaphroditum]|uniref:tRNA:m(4)X modification enzyme TRM13 n=1 Tax=Steinernema hermaphroditum TaxID=289476 RepID=A0AA39HRZ8_9BILA|nr:hypothetical protein QR680_005421 [Steinernema hermaphroditum]
MDENNRCTYILPKKKRKCRMMVKNGKRFCGEHAIHDPSEKDRIPCPLDPKHTVATNELEDHLAHRCNARISSGDPWIVENINVVSQKTEDSDEEFRPSEEELAEVIELVEKGYATAESVVKTRILEAPLVEKHLNEVLGTVNATHIKHLKQISSIIGNLLADDLLHDDEAHGIFELGAGKAQLAYWMAKTTPKCQFLLIDRMGARNKWDNKAIREDAALKMSRLRCSIEHLDLSKVDTLKGVKRTVSVCKHFCGNATDGGIRCLVNAVNNGFHMAGFALAPCCHHRSTFEEYAGHDFLKSLGIKTSRHFSALRHIATWATCGMMRSDQPTDYLPENPDELPPEKKENLGVKAKTILEVGRGRYLETIGYSVAIYRYVDSSVSPENLLIVGTKCP